MDTLIGSIMLWPLAWAPKDWLFCNGQELPIMQNQVLFALLGTTYGGDGNTTFALPNLNGRAPVGAQMGGVMPSGLASYELGAVGEESSPVSIAPADAGNPFLALNFIICTFGQFPSRH